MPQAGVRASDVQQGLWRNGSAFDSRSEGWEFESLWPHFRVVRLLRAVGELMR